MLWIRSISECLKVIISNSLNSLNKSQMKRNKRKTKKKNRKNNDEMFIPNFMSLFFYFQVIKRFSLFLIGLIILFLLFRTRATEFNQLYKNIFINSNHQFLLLFLVFYEPLILCLINSQTIFNEIWNYFVYFL